MKRKWIYLLLAFFCFAGFGLSFRDYFGSDDFGIVFGIVSWAKNARWQDILNIFCIWKPAFIMPLGQMIFLPGYILSGVEAWGYRLISIIFHLLTVILIFELVWIVLKEKRVALIASFIFCINGAHGQAVFWTAALPHIVATMFYLLTIFLFVRYLKSGKWLLYVGAIFSTLLSVSTKEESVTLFVALIMCEFLLMPSKRFRLRYLAKYLPFIFIFFVYAFSKFIAYLNIRDSLASGGHSYLLGLHVIKNFIGYLTQLGCPFLYQGVSGSVLKFIFYLNLCGLLFLGFLCWVVIRISPTMFPKKALVFFALCLIISPLPFLPFTSGLQSRYLYLPAVPFSIITAVAFSALWERFRGKYFHAVYLVMSGMYILFFCVLPLLLHERSAYVTGELSRNLMAEVKKATTELSPGTKIILVDSKMAVATASPIFCFSHPNSYRNIAEVINVTKKSAELEKEKKDPLSLIFYYEEAKRTSLWEWITYRGGTYHYSENGGGKIIRR